MIEVGKKYTFKVIGDSLLSSRDDEVVTVTRVILDEEESFDQEVLPMFEIVFSDGYLTHCWVDELKELEGCK